MILVMSANVSIYIFMIVLLGLIFVNTILIVLLYSKFSNMRRNQAILNKLFSGETVEELLFKNISEQKRISEELLDVRNDIIMLQERQKKNFDKINIVRYSASQDSDAKLSYSVGITNEREDGIVISGLYFRNGINLYVKHLSEGISDFKLSEEEEKVVERTK